MEKISKRNGGKWLAMAIAAIAFLYFAWVVDGLRRDLKDAAAALNENLPRILENSRKTSETLRRLSEDLEKLRNLAGLENGSKKHALVAFADRVLDLLESTEGNIGLTRKIIGQGLKNIETLQEWVAGARKEALFLTATANNRTEFLQRLCHNKFGSEWMIQTPGSQPRPLLGWLRETHPEIVDNPDTGPATLSPKN